MKWSWNIGKITGITIRLHATFLLLLAWVAMSYWVAGHNFRTILAGVAFIVALFACVLLHELGHATAARHFGIPTSDITLLPIGGLARLERMPEEWPKELWIALAGPLVNVAIAVALYFWTSFAHQWEPLTRLHVATGPALERLMVANIWLVLFNLIPAFPMDGGRVLRALLASRMTYARATRLAAVIGQGLALGFVFAGFFSSPMLIFIGLFVWIGASQEAGAVQMREALSDTPVRAAMLAGFVALDSMDTLAHAVQLTLGGWQHDFPVIHRGSPIGILTRNSLLRGLSTYGQDCLVTVVMQPDVPTAEPDEILHQAFQRLRASGSAAMPVVSRGRMVGLVTVENLTEYFLIDAALQTRKPSGFTAPVLVPGASPLHNASSS